MQKHSDEYWYECLLKEDSVSRSLTSMEKSTIISRSMQEAELQKERMEARFGRQSPEEYIRQLGFNIEEEAGEIMPSFLYMGLLAPDEKKVYLNHSVLTLVENYIKTHLPGEVQQLEKLREIVCFHELYHAVEECTEGIYTRNVRLKQRFMHLIPYYRKVESASEIGAVHFSKLMSDVQFSPYVYTQYALTAANNKLEVENER